MSEWTIQSTIRLFFEKWNSVKKCPRYVWIQKCPKMAFFSAKNQEIMKSSHFFLNELSLTIRTGFLWVIVTIWHWVCSNIPKIKDFRGYHPLFGTYFNFHAFHLNCYFARLFFSYLSKNQPRLNTNSYFFCSISRLFFALSYF